jgi:hypothetical protein
LRASQLWFGIGIASGYATVGRVCSAFAFARNVADETHPHELAELLAQLAS